MIDEMGVWQDELEVVFSVMTDKELMELKDRIEELLKREVYREEKFPLSVGGLRHVQATIMWAFWCRRGKGVRVDNGEIVVCELKESPFWRRYQQLEYVRDEETGEMKEIVEKTEVKEMIEEGGVGDWV